VTFPHETVADGDALRIGNIELAVRHAPGHTPDSICLLVTDHARGDEPWFVLTGDTLFVGSVGRPDLGGASAAEDLWHTLQRVLRPLPDGVEVYPAHGAGSSCGRAMSAKAASTIGFERRFNPAFRFVEKARFVDFIMEGIPPKPAAFETIVAKNRGLLPLAAAKPRPMSAREAWDAAQAGAVVLDLRDPGTHGEGHPAGALNVWIDGPQFPERVAGFLSPGARVILLPQAPSDVDRAVQALSRVGVDDVIGHLQWGMIDWRDAGLPVESVPQITAYDLHTLLESGGAVVVDVREPFEWLEGHVEGAIHLPMFEAAARAAELPAGRPKAVVCAGGLRSSTTISVLKRRVPGPWLNVTGGMGAWLKAGYGVTRA
jgi:rhodanese-related sulfurtransferase